MGGSVRVLDTDLRHFVMEEIERLGDTICTAHGCQLEKIMQIGYPACTVDDRCAALMQDVANSMDIAVPNLPPSLGAEDFGYFSQEKPCGIGWFGMGDPTGKHELTPHHNPKFYLYDEKGLPLALEYMLRVYVKASASL